MTTSTLDLTICLATHPHLQHGIHYNCVFACAITSVNRNK